MTTAVRDHLDLLDFRRRVAALYAELRARGIDEAGWRWWRAERDALFATHPASPIPPAQRATFTGLPFHDYDPAWHLGPVALEPVDDHAGPIGHSAAGEAPARRFATLALDLPGGSRHHLPVFWLDVYGGGVFVPFRDATNGASTYGGGRYLLDTVKAADLGGGPDHLVVDFNFAYHPSCVHDPVWSCPLAAADDALDLPVVAGERLA